MENIFFSIIIPIYNVEEYLAECLESIIFQTYQNYEVICVNDASTDNSYEILMEYKKQFDKIRVINNKINKGLSYSRNRGLEIAQGDYIFFVDSDDYITPNALSVIADVLMETTVDILNFNYDFKSEGTKKVEKNSVIHEKYQKDFSCVRGQTWFVNAFNNNLRIPLYVWNKIYRRVFLVEERLKFYEGVLYEDNLFFLQSIVKAERVCFIEDSLYVYRRRDGSITASISEKHLDSLVVILSEICFLWKNSELEMGMNEAIKSHINQRILPRLRTLMMYFPEHKEMKIGNPEDQFLFSLLQGFNVEKVRQYIDFNQDELNIIGRFDKRIIYGAGEVCSELILYLKNQKISIFSIAVSNKRNNLNKIAGYTICQIDELLKYRKEALIIVAVVKRDQEPIRQKLVDLGFENILLIDTDRLEKDGGIGKKVDFL